MPARIAILHGWSDTSKSFRKLREFLLANGYQAAEIWLSDYVSKDDDVRVEDVAKRMDDVIKESLAKAELAAPFDLIVHSTGGLVAREWVTRLHERGEPCPVKRLVMLAPANFGSRLASLGKSMLGRITKGWDNWFQTGTEMLKGLELASPYQWELARRDLFDPERNGSGPYGPDKVWPFVLIGTRGYQSTLRQIVNEYGADGTIRCPAGNLNAVGLTLDFASNPDTPPVRRWHRRSGRLEFPFAILPDRDHTSITEPGTATEAVEEVSSFLGNAIVAALRCETIAQYRALHEQWDKRNERIYRFVETSAALDEAFPNERDRPKLECFHQYMQIVTMVRDDHGRPVTDYFLEFAPEQRDENRTIYFHSEVLEHVHVNGESPSRRCLFIDRTDLMLGFYPKFKPNEPPQLAVSLSAAMLGQNIHYFDETKVGAKGHIVIHHDELSERQELDARLRRNQTHLVEIVIPRKPVPKVFRWA